MLIHRMSLDLGLVRDELGNWLPRWLRIVHLGMLQDMRDFLAGPDPEPSDV